MRNMLAAVAALLALGLAATADAQTKGTAVSRLRFARAICTTGPCNPFFNFRAGSIQIKRAKQPRPLTDRIFGRMRVDGLTSSGPPLPASLDGVVTARLIYDTDPDSDCVAAGTDTVQAIGTSSLNCTPGGLGAVQCRGDIVFNAGVLDDPNCTDVQVYAQDMTFDVYEDGGVGVDASRIARGGAVILGQTPDCNSGGSGCP
jgi:hypothetical protein